MADNKTFKDGAGADYTVALDELAGGVLIQRVKLATGPDGQAADVHAANPLAVAPSMPVASSVTITAAQTAANGTSWTDYPILPCKALDIVNNSSVTIEYRRAGGGLAMPIPAGAARMVIGITSANEISIRRVDQSATQLTVYAEAIA